MLHDQLNRVMIKFHARRHRMLADRQLALWSEMAYLAEGSRIVAAMFNDEAYASEWPVLRQFGEQILEEMDKLNDEMRAFIIRATKEPTE
jgi:hypothetical protein